MFGKEPFKNAADIPLTNNIEDTYPNSNLPNIYQSKQTKDIQHKIKSDSLKLKITLPQESHKEINDPGLTENFQRKN